MTGSADLHLDMAQKVCRIIEDHFAEPLTLADLGTAMDVSPAHLQRIFKSIIGVTPRQYQESVRAARLKSELRERPTVTDALFSAGYGSTSRVYEKTHAQLGMTPGTYRRGGKGMQLFYTFAPCPFGRLLFAATERGVSAVYLGEEDPPLEAALKKEYPSAELTKDDGPLQAWLKVLLEHLAGGRPHLDLPVDVQATAFQSRVWQELQKIPYGATKTYKEIAEALDQPTAVRAVGRACATNPVSVIIPCHRVLRGDGSLGGYRWGLDRKQALLDQEKEE